MGEHRRAVWKSDPNNSIAVHVSKSHLCIDWEKAKVVRSLQEYWEPRAMEVIEIKRSRSSMNLNRGLNLPSVWNPLLDQT